MSNLIIMPMKTLCMFEHTSSRVMCVLGTIALIIIGTVTFLSYAWAGLALRIAGELASRVH